jgi:hypothetical protein
VRPMSVTFLSATIVRPGPEALAMVVHELDRLPRVDDRYRLWPWSLRGVGAVAVCRRFNRKLRPQQVTPVGLWGPVGPPELKRTM